MRHLLGDITVNGTLIPAAAIANEAQNHPAPRLKPGMAWMAAARALALREILLHEARAQAITPAPVELAPGQVETDDEAMVRQLLDGVLNPEPASEADLRATWAADPGRFRAPTLYEAAHILFAAAPDDAPARARARAEAKAVLAKLRTDPGLFDALARDHSACPSRSSGGRLGQISAGDTVPEFEAALATMAEGALCEAPVASRYGLHIIRLDARVRGEVLPFETIAPRLRASAEKAAWVRACRDYVQGLVDRAEVTGLSLGSG